MTLTAPAEGSPGAGAHAVSLGLNGLRGTAEILLGEDSDPPIGKELEELWSLLRGYLMVLLPQVEDLVYGDPLPPTQQAIAAARWVLGSEPGCTPATDRIGFIKGLQQVARLVLVLADRLGLPPAADLDVEGKS
ncbi:DUF6415 family natural product biosynthesis protein [Streptomyces sp. NPDC059506]|uniref:DUF6415 family natural product biosynthesis protein n=1 Tax=Streptomyces sp. NPDC059506 TaxID=3347751 RepID=UPI00369E305F